MLFIQFLYKLSYERVIQDTQVNLANKWFVGLNPKDPLPDPTIVLSKSSSGCEQREQGLEGLVLQCIEKKLVKSNALIIEATNTYANTKKQETIEVLKDAAKRLTRAVTMKHPKLQKKLPLMPKLTGDGEERAKRLLHHLAELGEIVEALLPDAEGSVSEKLRFAKQIVEDERLLARKGIMSAIDPDARFGWKSNTVSFFGYKEHLAMTDEEIIAAVVVTPGPADNGKQLPTLLNLTQSSGIEVK